MKIFFFNSLVIFLFIIVFNGCQQNTSLPYKQQNTVNKVKKVMDDNDKFIKYEEYHNAIANNSLEQLKKAFEKNPIDIDTIVHKRGSLLYIALRGVETMPQDIYREEIVHYLVEEKQANVNLVFPDGFSPILAATNCGIKAIKYLESKGAIVTNVYINSKDKSYDGSSLLHFAAQSPKGVEIIKYLLTKGYNINTKSKIGTTPLINAINFKHFYINFKNVEYLVEQGADVNAKNSLGLTPLEQAVFSKDLEIVKYLVEHGANINIKDIRGFSPLLVATQIQELEIVKYLLKQGADVNIKSNDGFSPLLVAVINGQEEMVKYLAEYGVNINIKNNAGVTPLLASVMKGYKSILEYLISKEANPFDTINNYSAIDLANSKRHYNLVPILQNAQINYSNLQTRNIIRSFVQTKNYKALKIYIEANPDFLYFIEDVKLRLALTGPKGMKVGDIRKHIKNGRSEKIVISLIKQVNSPYKKFTLDEIDVLIKMGLSDNIISAMIDVTTQLLRDEKLKKQQETLIAEQQRIANQKQKVIVKERIIEIQVLMEIHS